MKPRTPTDIQAAEIDRRVRSQPAASAAFTAALAEIDALPEPGPVTAIIRGRLFVDLGLMLDAAKAFEQAVALAPDLADAHYELGLAYAYAGREGEALRAWRAAAEADPRHFDALFNAGQAHYNRGELEAALEMWRRAVDVDPQSFDALKKVVQAEVALGRDAAETRARLFEVWRASPRADVRGQRFYVFDQLDVEGMRVMALQPLADPMPKDADVMAFAVEGAPGRTVMQVRIETSEYGRERGTPYVISVTSGAGYRVVEGLPALPPYPELREKIRALVAASVLQG
jgi:tetratricopeptide (TPR) repeat protein